MFLMGAALSTKIREVLTGRDVACAVAFWGRGSTSLLTSAKGGRPRILCNVTLGGTNPDVLAELRATLGESLRHHASLHAKVYLSDKGLVVGSANASDNGVGLGGNETPSLMEAGSFHGPETEAWQDAVAWFEDVFSSAPVVDDAAVATARRTWVPPRTPMRRRRVGTTGSLLDIVCSRPDAFSDIGFVFVGESVGQDELDAINQQELDEGGQTGPGWNLINSFINWPREDVAAWPARFFEYWLRGEPRIFARETVRTRLDGDEGHVLARRCWLEMTRQLDKSAVQLSTRGIVAAADGTLARQIYGGEGRVFRNGFELIEALEVLVN